MAMTLDVPSDIEQRLDRLAEATGYSKSLFYPELIRMGIDDLEDYFEANAELARHRRGEGRTVSESDLRRELGLDD